jgi:hypothetical protein
MGRTDWNKPGGDLRQIGTRTKRTRLQVHLAGRGPALAFNPKNYSLCQLSTSNGTATSTVHQGFSYGSGFSAGTLSHY